jgi:hypothetical protein
MPIAFYGQAPRFPPIFLPKNGCVRAVIGENKKMRRSKNKTMHAFPQKTSVREYRDYSVAFAFNCFLK